MDETEEKMCKGCRYFNQHYVKARSGYMPTDYGHCTNPRLREKRPGTPACTRFSKR